MSDYVQNQSWYEGVRTSVASAGVEGGYAVYVDIDDDNKALAEKVYQRVNELIEDLGHKRTG